MMLLVLTFLNSVPVSVSLAVYLAECGPEKKTITGKISWLVFRFIIVYMHKNRFFLIRCLRLIVTICFCREKNGRTVLIMLMEGCNSFISQPTITIWEVPECLTTSVLLLFLGVWGLRLTVFFFKFAQ